jgi:hypothetical protein
VTPREDIRVQSTQGSVMQGSVMRGRLCGELRAALGAARRKNCTTSASAHAQAEAMHLRTATVVGLESALAHEDLRCVGLIHPVDEAARKSE